jgi:hypothetical protein
MRLKGRGQHDAVIVVNHSGELTGRVDLIEVFVPGTGMLPAPSTSIPRPEQTRNLLTDGPYPQYEGALTLDLAGDPVLPALLLLRPAGALGVLGVSAGEKECAW